MRLLICASLFIRAAIVATVSADIYTNDKNFSTRLLIVYKFGFRYYLVFLTGKLITNFGLIGYFG